jgi:hypothetical protein
MGNDEAEKSVKGRFEWTVGSLSLRNQKTTLNRGEQAQSEIVDVNISSQVTGVAKTLQPLANRFRPLLEPGGNEVARFGIALRNLPDERSKGTPPLHLGLFRSCDDLLLPNRESVRAVNFCAPLILDDRAGLIFDDRLNEFVLVREIVVHLRTAYVRGVLDVIERGGYDAMFVDEAGRDSHDVAARSLPLGCEGRAKSGVVGHGDKISVLSLTTHSKRDRMSCATQCNWRKVQNDSRYDRGQGRF